MSKRKKRRRKKKKFRVVKTVTFKRVKMARSGDWSKPWPWKRTPSDSPNYPYKLCNDFERGVERGGASYIKERHRELFGDDRKDWWPLEWLRVRVMYRLQYLGFKRTGFKMYLTPMFMKRYRASKKMLLGGFDQTMQLMLRIALRQSVAEKQKSRRMKSMAKVASKESLTKKVKKYKARIDKYEERIEGMKEKLASAKKAKNKKKKKKIKAKIEKYKDRIKGVQAKLSKSLKKADKLGYGDLSKVKGDAGKGKGKSKKRKSKKKFKVKK